MRPAPLITTRRTSSRATEAVKRPGAHRYLAVTYFGKQLGRGAPHSIGAHQPPPRLALAGYPSSAHSAAVAGDRP